MNKITKEYLNTIAERLKNNQASLFVGAGFSKNATLQTGAKVPPNWDELGDVFFEKTRKRKPNKSDRAYANVLRLAEDVENMYGRPILTQLIKEAINDDLLTPSDTHMRLLALPWQDVYTTNYDTLLDRSAARLNEQNKRFYTIRWNSQDIGMGSSPFLIKVHGDINDTSSIIITEEDYRKYPRDHSAMINHIRNTIMTKTLVMIGFSGNDPNFIEWLGWVRDALSNNFRKLYLLSIDKLSEAELKTFEKKNVVVVDIRNCGGKGASTSDNISAAINYLEDSLYKSNRERTEYRNTALKWGRTSHKNEVIDKTLEIWKQERDSYPGWLVMPRETREYWVNYEGFYLSKDKLSQLGKEADILYLDLFNWRIEKSLYPIENDWEDIYLSVLAKYKPFSRRCRAEIRLAWLNLKLGLLRLYRQEGWRDKWQLLCDELHSLKPKMSDEQRCRFDYEQALEAVYRNDFKTLKQILLKWEKAGFDIYWDIRRGALWAEYLSFEKGKEITHDAFKCICERLEKADTEEERFYWASRKVHAHTVWNCMAQANFSDGLDETSSARKTWQELRPYEDIWYEREFFDHHLRPIEETLKVKTKNASFRLGYSSITTNISHNSKDYRIAYAYFLYYEETGFPIHLPFLNTIDKSSLEKALSVMSYCSPAIAECWLLRSGDSNMVKSVYNRRYLERTSFDKVDALYKHYLYCFSKLLQIDDSSVVPSWVLAIRSTLPEILSRLCMKASYDARIKTLDYIDVVFLEKESIRYDGIDRLLSSLLSSFSKKEIEKLIPRMARMAIGQDRFGDCRLEPMFYIHDPYEVTDSLTDVIDDLLNRWGADENNDKAISCRLLYLYQCLALSDTQQELLAEKLWSKCDRFGFPSGTIFNRFTILSFPHPKRVNPEALLKDYFKKETLPIVGNGSTISFFGGHIPLLNNLKGTTNDDILFVWDKTLLNLICSRLIDMWDADKKGLLKEEQRGLGFSVKEELQGRFDDVETIITFIMVPNLHMLEDDNKEGLARMADEFETYDMPSLRMKLALSETVVKETNLQQEILKRLTSTDNRVINDCIRAIILLDRRGENVKEAVEWICDSFRCNSTHGQISFINAVSYFVDKYVILDNETILQKILLGLERLFEDTKIEETDDELTATNKLNLRLSTAPVVKTLVRKYQGVLPHTLYLWQGYYKNDETCWDIKNSYIDN